MKKIISILTAAVLAFASLSVMAFTDMPEGNGYQRAIEKLSALNMLSGYEDGAFRPEQFVTRAEFAKMTVLALGKQEMATGAAGRFWDVADNHWASGYMNYVAENGYIKGYPDGSFRPNENIPFEQVITILVRMLGYTADEVGYHWPRDYIDKSSVLGITDGVYYNQKDWMTRKDVALLLDRTLETDINGKTGTKLIDTTGFQLVENVTVIATKEQDASLLSDVVKTSNGSYKYIMPSIHEFVGTTGSIYLNKAGKIQYIEPKAQTKRTVVVNSVVDNVISFMENGTQGVVKPNDNTVVYANGQAGAFLQSKSGITQGTTLSLYYNEEGALEYIMMDEGETLGPVTVTALLSNDTSAIGGISISEGARVYRNGLTVALSDLKIDDIVYYTPSSNVVMAYDEKRTGIYEEAYPSKAFVSSIKLSGVTYEIESNTALHKLNESAGAYKKNDKITLLLGKDGKIADVKSSSDLRYADLAVLLSTSKEISQENDTKGKMEYYITVLRADGNEYTYKADKDFENYRGALVEMESGADGRITRLERRNSSISGTVNTSKRKIGSHTLAKDCKIIELLKSPDKGESFDAVARVIEWEDIDQKELTARDVIHAQRDDQFGDITLLYLNNISNDGYLYGLLKKSNTVNKGMMVSGQYTVDAGGTEYNFSLSAAYSIPQGSPVGVNIAAGRLIDMFKLPQAASGKRVKAVDYNRIKLDNSVYDMSPDAVVYRRTNNYFEKEAVSLNELTEMEYTSVQMYADKALSSGGKVRVIMVS